MIKIIQSLDLGHDYKCWQNWGVSIYNKKWQHVHLHQGDMDGAGAVYSMMMYLISLKVLTRKQVIDLNTKFDGRVSKGRLYKEFFTENGLCRDGFYFTEIESKLQHSFAKTVTSHAEQYDATAKGQQKMLSAIRQSLDCDEPIMIAEVFKQGGAHAILAIGYEERNNEITKLFCLDPGSAIPCNAYWNMVIIINQNPNSKYSHISIDSDNRSSDVYVDETLIIKRK